MEENRNFDVIENLFVGKLRFVNLTIVGICTLIFVVVNLMPDETLIGYLYYLGASNTELILRGEYYRLFTCMFLHVDIYHLVGNMMMILFVGDELENIVGHFKYIVLVIISGLAGSIATVGFDIMNNTSAMSVGASGMSYGILGGMIACIIRKKEKRNISVKMVIAITILMLITDSNSGDVNVTAHLGGLVCGFIIGMII